MRRPLCIFSAILAVSCSNNGLDRKLSELNRELERKEYHMERFRERMDSLRLELGLAQNDSLKWENAYSLFSAYSYVNVDSTRHYLDILSSYASSAELALRSEVCRIRTYGVEQDTDKLFASLSNVNSEKVSRNFKQRYFDELQRAFVLCPENTALKKEILSKALEFDGLGKDIRKRYEGLLLLYDEEAERALPYFSEAYELASSNHIKALTSYNQATCYNMMGDKTRYCLWLAEAAIYDIKVPVSEYLSLIELSQALFLRGDYSNASKYIQVVLNDAIEGNWDSRIHISATEQRTIFEALGKSQRQIMFLMNSFIAFLLVSVASVLFLLILRSRQNRHLRSLNRTVTAINSRLKDEGRIKENYLFKYMEMSVEGIGRLEDYRHRVKQTLKEEGADALNAMLRSPYSRADYKTFYKNFDNTFLSLYPDFIKQVNSLMKEDCAFREEGVLNTDLRILATIRLGFNDSGQIARFLNIPASSVYTRRSAIRRNSTCSKEEFDLKIREII